LHGQRQASISKWQASLGKHQASQAKVSNSRHTPVQHQAKVSKKIIVRQELGKSQARVGKSKQDQANVRQV
jgi:hypothetical protein